MKQSKQTMNRRRFLKKSAIAAATFGVMPYLFSETQQVCGEDAKTPQVKDYWILLSDIHIPANVKQENRTFNPNKQLEQAREEILALPEKPKGIIVTGDLVYLQGKIGDYQTLGKQLEPFDKAEIPVYLTLGNHDNYENFTKTLPRYAFQTPIEGKQVSIVESSNVNFFLLDSLEKTNSTPGILGEKQIEWLAAELDKRPNKPAILAAHHDIEKRYSALKDREPFWEVVKSRKQVKAYLYGHTHIYRNEIIDNVHVINLPAMGWNGNADPTDKTHPLGWCEAMISPDSLELKLHALEKEHPQNHEINNFKWLR